MHMSSKHKHKSKNPPEKTPVELLELLDEVIDVEKLIDNIAINEDDVIRSAMKQPLLFWTAGRLRVQKMNRRAHYELTLEKKKSEAGLKVRKIKDDSGKREYTEGAVKARIELDPDVRQLRHKLDNATAEEELSKTILEAYRMRRDIIRIVIDAGKISLHMKELELLKGSKTLRRAVNSLRDRWKNQLEDTEE